MGIMAYSLLSGEPAGRCTGRLFSTWQPTLEAEHAHGPNIIRIALSLYCSRLYIKTAEEPLSNLKPGRRNVTL